MQSNPKNLTRSLRRFAWLAARVFVVFSLLLGTAFVPAQTAHAGPPITMTVNTTADSIDASPGNGVCADSSGYCSLRAAIMEANADPGSTILFDASLNTTPIVLTRTGNDYTANAGDLDINASTTITGNGASNTIIQAAADASYTGSIQDKVFGINQSGLYPNLTVSFSGLTIRYGDNNIPTTDLDFAFTGGGVDVYFTGSGNSTTFTNCVISNNRSRTSYGGGLNVDSNATGTNTLTLTNVTFSNNSTMSTMYTATGGALNVYGNNVTVNISNSAFTNNTVPAGTSYGGAINSRPNSGSLTIDRTVFSGNSAWYGGAIFADSGPTTIIYSRIVGNTAAVAGSGLYVDGSTVTAENNWWGCSTGPGAAPCDTAIILSGTLDYNPWLRNQLTPLSLVTNQSATLTASFLTNSAETAVPVGNLGQLINHPVTWGATGGSLSGQQTTVQVSGTATANFQATGVGVVYAKVDNDNTSGASSNVINIGKATTTTTITSDTPDPSSTSQAVTIAFNVAGAYGNSPTAPTGLVTISDGTQNCTDTLIAADAGVGSCNITFATTGAKTLTAIYAGDANFNTSTSATEAHTVSNLISQSITFTSTAPGSAVVGGATYTPTATGGASGNPVVFTIDAAAASVCSISGGGVVSFQAVGTCVINANQAGNANYNAAPQVQQSFAVGQGSQGITFTSTAPGSAVVGGATYTPTATGGASGNPVVFTIDAAAASVCSISGGGVVSFQAAGTCVINANQAGNTNYSAAPQVQQSFAVGQGSQGITFTSTAPGSAVVGGATYTPTATGGASGNPVVFTIDAAAASVCSISGGGVVSFQAAGTCVINANQAGNANYSAAPQVQQSFAVGQGSQGITFTSTAPGSAVVGGATYTPTATGGASGNPVVFTIDAAAASICSISGGGVVSFQAAGTCVINANQAGNANYNAAPQVQQSFAVGQGSQGITFTSTAPGSAVVGGATYTPTATGGASGNPVVFTIDAAAASVCSISGGGVVSFQAAGTCVINANQAGNANYNAAPQVQQSFAVGQGSQGITFTSTAPGSAVVGGATYTPTATGGASGNPVVFTIDAAAASVCSISGGGVVSFQAAGTCVINANQAGNANYSAAPQVQQSFAVGQGSQGITFTSTAPGSAVVGGATYTPTATGGASGNPVVFTIDAAAVSVCSISGGGVVSFQAAGTCVINANQAGNANYNAAPQVQQSFAVGQGSQGITFTSTAPGSAVVGGATYTPTATGGASGNPVVFTIDAAAVSVCSISGGGVVSFQAAGTCVINANQAGNANYNAAPQVQQSFAVGQGSQGITFTSTAPGSAVVGGATYTPTATGGASGNPVVFTIDAAAVSVCSISGGGVVSFQAAGTCVINANQAGNANYNAAPQVQQSFAVGIGTPVITWNNPASIVTGTALSGTQLNATANVPGSFVYTPAAGVILPVGNHSLHVDFTPTDAVNYTNASRDVSITVTSGGGGGGGGGLVPTIIASDGTYLDKVNLTWTPISGASYYLVYRSESLDGVKIPTSGYRVTSLGGDDPWNSPGVTYYYWVKACDAISCGDFSAPDTGWRGLPAPVITASDGAFPDKVQVTFPAVNWATSYLAYRSLSQDGVKIPTDGYFTIVPGGNDFWAAPGVTYYYWVKACNGLNCSALSAYDTGWR